MKIWEIWAEGNLNFEMFREYRARSNYVKTSKKNYSFEADFHFRLCDFIEIS